MHIYIHIVMPYTETREQEVSTCRQHLRFGGLPKEVPIPALANSERKKNDASWGGSGRAPTTGWWFENIHR